MTLRLVAIARKANTIELKYGEAVDDPHSFTLIVSSTYVAHETAKSPPVSGSDLHAYILTHVTKLKEAAESCKARGLASKLLQ